MSTSLWGYLTMLYLQNAVEPGNTRTLPLQPALFLYATLVGSQWFSRVYCALSFDPIVRDRPQGLPHGRGQRGSHSSAHTGLFAKEPVRACALRASLFMLGMGVASIQPKNELNYYGMIALILSASILTTAKLQADINEVRAQTRAVGIRPT